MSPQTRDRSGRRGALKASEHLRAGLERLGLNQIDVSKATGVTRQTINNVVNGRQPISRAMAAKLGRLTGRGSDYWLQDSFAAPKPRSQSATRASMLVDHQIVRAIKDQVIDVAGFDESRVRAASLDLTLGAVTAPRGVNSARGVRVARGAAYASSPTSTSPCPPTMSPASARRCIWRGSARSPRMRCMSIRAFQENWKSTSSTRANAPSC